MRTGAKRRGRDAALTREIAAQSTCIVEPDQLGDHFIASREASGASRSWG